MASVSIRMDDALKQQTETVLEQLGLNMSTAFTMFAKAVVRENGISFLPLRADPFYSAENLAVLHKTIEEYETGRAALIPKTMEELRSME
ncbi:MAG: type II toxin-antitoxin system RelB/DinJ family antitoxin [Oscillibacter sp.]|nr:type II toxin-antitoxin system RelB/DinJ family antitoxin [Oscillibacter sp.]